MIRVGDTPAENVKGTPTIGAALDDARLSFRARGVLVAIAAGADTIAELARESPHEGRDAVRTAVQELLDLGYVYRQATPGNGSRLVRTLR